MNHVYRLVWSKLNHALIAVAETAGSRSKEGGSRPAGRARAASRRRPQRRMLAPALAPALAALLGAGSAASFAATLPTGFDNSLNPGSITQSVSGNTMTLNQTAAKAIVQWGDFSIGAGGTVQFNQPGASAITLNRVVGTPGVPGSTIPQSVIDGILKANGNIFLLNPSGIVFGSGSQVNVNGLVASTLDISNSDFNNGKFDFSGPTSDASIVNKGTLAIGNNGFVYLIAPTVSNEGTIGAQSGVVATVTLANDGHYKFGLSSDGLISFQVSGGTHTGASTVANAAGGAINAQQVLLSAAQAGNVISAVVNSGGIQAASSLTADGSSTNASITTQPGGTVLTAGMDASGNVTSSAATDVGLGFARGSAGDVNLDGYKVGGAGTLGAVASNGDVSGSWTDAGDLHVNGISGNNVSLTVNGSIAGVNLNIDPSGGSAGVGAANATDISAASALTLKTTQEGGVIGRNEGENVDGAVLVAPLSIHAQTLDASTNQGHIVVTDQAAADGSNGDLTLIQANTGDNTAAVGTRAIISVQDGKLLAGNNNGNPNVTAWAANLQNNGIDWGGSNTYDIGSAANPITTSVAGLAAGTQDGAIYIRNTGAPLVLGAVVAREAYTQNGQNGSNQTNSSGSVSGDGSIKLGNGAAGHFDVDIDTDQNLVATDAISATRNVSLTAGGSIFTGNSNNQVTGANVTLDAGSRAGTQIGTDENNNPIVLAGGIGQVGLGTDSANLAGLDTPDSKVTGKTAQEILALAGAGPLNLISNHVTATARDGGVYLKNSATPQFNVDQVSATGTDGNGNAINDVGLTGTLGDVVVNHITAAGGAVSVTANGGNVYGTAVAAPDANITADSANITAKQAIGHVNQPLYVDVKQLTTSAGGAVAGAGAGTYVTDRGALTKVDATTNSGNVVIGDSTGKVSFDGTSMTLGNTTGVSELDFNNANGNVNVGNLSVDTLSLKALGSINQVVGGLLAGRNVTLATQGNAGVNVTTKVSDSLNVSAAYGDVAVDNSAQTTGTLAANLSASKGNVSLKTGGALEVGTISATNNTPGAAATTATVAAGGALTQSTASGANGIVAGSAKVTGDGIGTQAAPLQTAVTGDFDADALSGALYLNNNGSLTRLTASAGGDMGVNVSGSAILGRLQSGGDITFTLTGTVANADGGAAGGNIQTGPAGTLTLSAQQIGASTAPLQINVDQLVLDTTSGGIYIRNTSGKALQLVHARASGGDASIETDQDMALGSVFAPGNDATLISDNGAITDARPQGSTDPNVQARQLTIHARNGIGSAADPLALDIAQLSASSDSGQINTVNLGSLAIDASNLTGKGTGGVTIVATSIVLLDGGGQTITMDQGGSLTLAATNGNIVFLNQKDTIDNSGGGNVLLSARADPDPAMQGYNGNIIAGNLTTSDGGNIVLDADHSVTIGMLDAGHSGNVIVLARDGVILDGNGPAENVRANHAILIANTPTAADATTRAETAVADYSAKNTLVSSTTLSLNNWQTALSGAEASLGLAITGQNAAQRIFDADSVTANNWNTALLALTITDDVLAGVLQAAGLVVDGVTIYAGTMQSVPFWGDGGADLALAIAATVKDSLGLALDIFERAALAPVSNAAGNASDQVITDGANLQDAITNTNTWTSLRNTNQINVDNDTQALFKATYERDAAGLLRQQALDARTLAQAVDMSPAKPLGIEANTLDMGTGDVASILGSVGTGSAAGFNATKLQPLDSGAYLDSNGSLGLGNFTATGPVDVTNVAGDISVVGDVVSQAGTLYAPDRNGTMVPYAVPSHITLQAGGAIQGEGGLLNAAATAGRLFADAVSLQAGTGIGASGTPNLNDGVLPVFTTPVQMNTGLAAATSLTGDVFLANDGDANARFDWAQGAGHQLNQPGRALTVGSVDGIDGVSTDGDIGVQNAGDLLLAQAISDTNLATPDGVYLYADDGQGANAAGQFNGSIVDDNGAANNITAHDLSFHAAANVGQAPGHAGLDTAVDRVVDGQSTGRGDITLHNTSPLLDIVNLANADGNQTVTNSGDLLLRTLTAGSTASDTPEAAGNVVLTSAGGNIVNDGDNATRVTGKTLTMTAAQGSIGAIPPTPADHNPEDKRSIDATVNRLTADAGGEIDVTNTGDLDAEHVVTTATAAQGAADSNQNITLWSLNGTLRAGSIVSDGAGSNVTLWAPNGSIGALDELVKGTSLALYGAHGIGTGAAPLTLEGSNLAADAGDGGMYLRDENTDLTVTTVTPNLELASIYAPAPGQSLAGLQSTGDLQLAVLGGNGAAGNLTVDQDITQKGAGNVTITSAGGQTYNANVAAAGDATLTSSGGDIVVSVGRQWTSGGTIDAAAQAGAIDFKQGARASAAQALHLAGDTGITLEQNNALIAQAGDATLASANGPITMGPGSQISAGNDVVADAGQTVTLAAGSTGAAGRDVVVTSHAGDVTMQPAGSRFSAGRNAAISAAGSANLTQVNAAGQATVTATGGSINNVNTDRALINVTAPTLIASAATGIGSGAAPLMADIGNLTAAVTGTGNLNLNNRGNLTVNNAMLHEGAADITTGGNFVTAAGGAVRAQALTFQAAGPVDVDTAVGVVNGANVDGDLVLRNQSDLYAQRLLAGNGNLSVSDQGGLLVGTLASGGAAGGTAVLAATGDIIDDWDGGTRVTATHVALQAGGSIGAKANPLATVAPQDPELLRPIDTTAATLTAQAGGEINVMNDGDLQAQSVVTTASANPVGADSAGNITLYSSGGALQVGTIATPNGTVTLWAPASGGTITALDASGRVVATSLALLAGSGIGTPAAPLQTQVQAVSADAGTGGMYLTNQDDPHLAIGGVTPNLKLQLPTDIGIRADGTVQLADLDGTITHGSGGANDIDSDALDISAAHGIASADDPLLVATNALTANGGDGGVYINFRKSSDDPTHVGDVSGGGDIDIGGNGPVDIGGNVQPGDGHSVTLGGSTVVNNGGAIGGAVVDIHGDDNDMPDLNGLLGNVAARYRVMFNGRTVGGRVTNDSQWVQDLIDPVGVKQSTNDTLRFTPYLSGFQPEQVGSDIWHFNVED